MLFLFRESLSTSLRKYIKKHTFKTLCDTETLLALFIEYGSNSLEMCDGMFAFIIYDIENNKLTAIITPDVDIIENTDDLSPAYLVFKNYELILKWNRSLRFALAVCQLKNKFENEL